MTAAADPGPKVRQRVVVAATAMILIAVVALLRVPTTLGVKVEEAILVSPGNAAIEPDKRGNEYIWRIWWRAQDEMVDVSPDWLLGLILVGVLGVFLGATFAAYRLVLSIPSGSPARDV